MTHGKAASPSKEPDMLDLALRLTNHPILANPVHRQIKVGRSATIRQLKCQIEAEWDGQPKSDGVTCILGGRVVRDGEVLSELFDCPPTSDGSHTSVDPLLHVIVRPSAWSKPFTGDTHPTAQQLRNSKAEPETSSKAAGLEEHLASPAIGDSPSVVEGMSKETENASLPENNTENTSLPTDPILKSASTDYSKYIAHLSQLIPLQRSLLLLNLHKAHFRYKGEVEECLAKLGWGVMNDRRFQSQIPKGVHEPHGVSHSNCQTKEENVTSARTPLSNEVKLIQDMIRECGLWVVVETAEMEAMKQIVGWQDMSKDVEEFQLVQIGGQSFLLQIPQDFIAQTSQPPPEDLFWSLKRNQAILQILATMIHLLIVYQPIAPSVAYGRALLRSAGVGRRGIGVTLGDIPSAAAVGPEGIDRDNDVGGLEFGAFDAAGGAGVGVGAGPLMQGAVQGPRPRRATVSIVINLEAIVSILIPLLLLSLKLAFLLWILGRHASPAKRVVLFAMAAGWVVWEGWVMGRRRVGAARDRERPNERLERERRQNAANVPGAQPGGIPVEPEAHALPRGELRRRGGLPGGQGAGAEQQPGRRAGLNNRNSRDGRPPVSRLTPRYWLNWIAAVGLAEEAREMGLIPRSIAGRPIPPAPQANDRIGQATHARRRAFQTALIGVMLFFGTLSPEVERKRKKALDKRERLLAVRRANREQRAAAAAAAASAIPSTSSNAAVGQKNLTGSEKNTSLPSENTSPDMNVASLPAGSMSNDTGSKSPVAPPSLPRPPSTSTLKQALPELLSDGSPDDRLQPLEGAGRSAVSDEELFASGLDEAHERPLPGADRGNTPRSSSGQYSGAQGEPVGADIDANNTFDDLIDDDEEEEADRRGDEGGGVDQVVALF